MALERYCQWVLDECERISRKEALSAHERFLEIYKMIQQRNKVIAEIFDVLSRSKASIQLLLMRKHGIVNEEEEARFSE